MPDTSENKVVPIYILAGQSNAERMGVDAALSESLGEMAGVFELVKFAIGGTSLAYTKGTDWYPQSRNELYDTLLAAVRERIAHVVEQGGVPEIAGVFWIQGEADASYDFRAVLYKANLTALINRLRADLGTEMPFVISGLSIKSAEPYNATVRQAQIDTAATVHDVTLVNTDDLGFQNGDIHYDGAARQELGHRLARALTPPTHADAPDGYESLSGPQTFTGTDGADSLDYGGDEKTHEPNDYRALSVYGLGGDDRIETGGGDSRIDGGAGNDSIYTYLGDDVIYGGDGNDTIYASYTSGALLGAGSDQARWNLDNDFVDGGAGDDLVVDLIGDNMIVGGDGKDYLITGGGDDAIYGGADNDRLRAGVGTDLLFGEAGNDTLEGEAGEDQLDGGDGNDVMKGGAGNDYYVVEQAGDIVYEAAGEGIDTIYTDTLSITLGANIERLSMGGNADLNGYGNALDNSLLGTGGNNYLYGGLGADTMAGLGGNDTYVVDSYSDIVREWADAGTDTVRTTLNYKLGANVENLVLTGAGDVFGNGNSLDNRINGNAGNNPLRGYEGNDRLDGGAGGDTMAGGIGDDTYYVDNAADQVVEVAGEGTDRVYASVDFATLNRSIEYAILTGTADISLTGNNNAESLQGNAGANLISAGAGDDKIDGAGGDDSLRGGAGADVFRFLAGSGHDTILDFRAAQNDRIDIHAYAHGTINGGGVMISQAGSDLVIDLGGGNAITVVGARATDAAFLSHIVW